MQARRNRCLSDDEDRERLVLQLLEELPWEHGAILIGGYAIAAYGPARYSDDIDFVIPAASREAIESWFRSRGFDSPRPGGRSSRQTFRDAIRLERESITVDLLIGGVRDREALVDIPERWISLRSRRVRLDLLTGRLSRAATVARPEALWALKLQAGREQDLTDLFAIHSEPVGSQEVLDLFSSLMQPTLRTKLNLVLARVQSDKLYRDSRSRLELNDTEKARETW